MDNLKVAKEQQQGFMLLELLLALSMMSLIGLGLSYTMGAVYKSNLVSKRGYSVSEAVQEKAEEFALINPELLNDSYDGFETVQVSGTNYILEYDITILSNRSRQVVVEGYVSGDQERGKISLTNSFALWGKR